MLGSIISIGGKTTALGIAIANSATTTSGTPSETTFGPTFWATIGLIVTSIAGSVFTLYRESRNRRWERQDAADKAEIARLTTQNRELVAKTAAELGKKIDENTQISVDAFKAANDLNLKMVKAQETVAAAAETVAAAVQQSPPPSPPSQ